MVRKDCKNEIKTEKQGRVFQGRSKVLVMRVRLVVNLMIKVCADLRACSGTVGNFTASVDGCGAAALERCVR